MHILFVFTLFCFVSFMFLFLRRVLVYGPGQCFDGNNQALNLITRMMHVILTRFCQLWFNALICYWNRNNKYNAKTKINKNKKPSNQTICLKDWKQHWYLSRMPWKSMILASHLYVSEKMVIRILCLTQIYNVHVIHITSLTSGSELLMYKSE